jgi:hypothetical protein
LDGVSEKGLNSEIQAFFTSQETLIPLSGIFLYACILAYPKDFFRQRAYSNLPSAHGNWYPSQSWEGIRFSLNTH